MAFNVTSWLELLNCRTIGLVNIFINLDGLFHCIDTSLGHGICSSRFNNLSLISKLYTFSLIFKHTAVLKIVFWEIRCTINDSYFHVMERHSWHLMLNIYKHTTFYNMYCSYFFIRSILNIMYDSLNTLCCSFLITRSGFVTMRCRSYKWCSSLIITCCAFINCRTTCYFMYSRYNIIRSIPLIIRCSKFNTCCGYIFQ